MPSKSKAAKSKAAKTKVSQAKVSQAKAAQTKTPQANGAGVKKTVPKSKAVKAVAKASKAAAKASPVVAKTSKARSAARKPLKGAAVQTKSKSAPKEATSRTTKVAAKTTAPQARKASGQVSARVKTAVKAKAPSKGAVPVKPKHQEAPARGATKARAAGAGASAKTKARLGVAPAVQAKAKAAAQAKAKTRAAPHKSADPSKMPAKGPTVDPRKAVAPVSEAKAVLAPSESTGPTPSAPVRTADTKSVAAALLAARRKAAPVPSSANDLKAKADNGVQTVKGMVEVADKNVQKTVVENKAPVVPVQPAGGGAPVAPVAPASVAVAAGLNRRPGFPPRFSSQIANPGAKGAVKPGSKHQGFKTNEFIVYPAHGVGEIVAIEEQEVAGYKLELFVISFVKDKMILKVPLPKIASVGMRKLAEAPVVKRALDTLTGRARIKRTMWSRRAQEYEAKINSGDLVSIAEVVRDLYRSDAQPEQSYSERQLYEAALDRMAREISVVQALTDAEALKVIDEQLRKGPRRGKADETETEEADEAEDVEGNIGEAA